MLAPCFRYAEPEERRVGRKSCPHLEQLKTKEREGGEGGAPREVTVTRSEYVSNIAKAKRY